MIINKHTQLALRMDSEPCQDRFFNNMSKMTVISKGYTYGKASKFTFSEEAHREMYEFLSENDAKLFLIRDSALKEAENMDIEISFSGSLFSRIPQGKYTYLLGPNKMFKYEVKGDRLSGIYYADLDSRMIPFSFSTTIYEQLGIKDVSTNKYFKKMIKLIIYIELADIQVELIEPGNISKHPSKDVRETNESSNNIYVVDSSWNTLIIRNEGFSVKGHYRLQPCGEGMRDRKLIWINHFEKHGYIRRPKARVLHNSIS